MNIPTGYAQINHFFSGIAYPRGAQITYGLHRTGASEVAAMAEEAHSFVNSAFHSFWPTNLTLVKTRCKWGPTETGPFAEFSDAIAGANAEAPDAPQVAVLITKETALGGRTNRGRFFLPGLAESMTNSGGVIASATVADLGTRCDGWLTAIEAGTNMDHMVLLHNLVEETPTDVTALVVQQLVATQRRRLRKVGGRRRIIP